MTETIAPQKPAAPRAQAAATSTAKKPAAKSAATAKPDSAGAPAETAQAWFDDMQARAENFRTAASGAAEAVQNSVEAASEGAQALNTEAIALFQDEMDRAIRHASDIMSAKSLLELVEKQTAFGSALFESRLQAAANLREASAETARKTTAPLTAMARDMAERTEALSASWSATK